MACTSGATQSLLILPDLLARLFVDLVRVYSEQAQYCSVECKRTHWKVGSHKVFCKGMKAIRITLNASAKRAAVAGECIICLDNKPRPIQSGCGCRGPAGLAHIECRVTAAEHGIQSGRLKMHGQSVRHAVRTSWEPRVSV
jgi:hypothetical protein